MLFSWKNMCSTDTIKILNAHSWRAFLCKNIYATVTGIPNRSLYPRTKVGFSTVMPPPPQRFPFGRDNLKNILVRPFKFCNATNAIVL